MCSRYLCLLFTLLLFSGTASAGDYDVSTSNGTATDNGASMNSSDSSSGNGAGNQSDKTEQGSGADDKLKELKENIKKRLEQRQPTNACCAVRG